VQQSVKEKKIETLRELSEGTSKLFSTTEDGSLNNFVPRETRRIFEKEPFSTFVGVYFN